jgi:hypothetical protein
MGCSKEDNVRVFLVPAGDRAQTDMARERSRMCEPSLGLTEYQWSSETRRMSINLVQNHWKCSETEVGGSSTLNTGSVPSESVSVCGACRVTVGCVYDVDAVNIFSWWLSQSSSGLGLLYSHRRVPPEIETMLSKRIAIAFILETGR